MPRRGAAVPHIATVSVCAERRNGRRERELELSHSRVEEACGEKRGREA